MTSQGGNRGTPTVYLRFVSLTLMVLSCLARQVPAASPPPEPGAPSFVAAKPDLAFLASDTTDKSPGGTLDAFEDDLSRNKTQSRAQDDDDDDSFWGAFAGEILWQIGPSLLFGFPSLDDEEGTLAFAGARFTSHPYASPDEGLFSPSGSRPFALNGSCAWFRQDDDLSGVVASVQCAPFPLVGIEAQYARFQEELQRGTGRLSITNAFLNYYRVRAPRWAVWWGLGAKCVHGRSTHTGFALNLATRIYPAKPLSLRLQTSIGFVGDKTVSEYVISVAGHWKRVAPLVGYQAWSTGSTTLKGFVGGLDMHF